MNDILNCPAKDGAKLEHISMNDEVRTKYVERNGNDQEQMGWSLLKAVGFFRLLALFNTNT